MWDISYDLKKKIHMKKKGYEFIKTVDLYIPHYEVGLNILVRKEQSISFFTEIILKLIDNKCSSIVNISEITGVEEEILNDVVGGMSNSDLIHIRSGNLVLTPQGEAAIKTLRETLIEKEELNRTLINAITGKIVEIENLFKRPNVNNPCLDGKVTIDEEFLGDHFNDINDYYQKRRDELEIDDNYRLSKNEIYQILSKEYEKLCYSEKKTYVYKNLKDNDLLFECENDKDNIYASLLSSQIHNSTGARNLLKNKFDTEKYLGHSIILDPEKSNNTDELIELLKNDDMTKTTKIEKMDSKYFVSRYLLEREYMDILYSMKNIKPTDIYISSSSLSDVLNDTVIGSLKTVINNNNTKLTIICDKSDKGRSGIKNKIYDLNPKKRELIKWIEKQDILQTNILIYPYCSIEIHYSPIEVGKDYLIKEIADITFSIKDVDDTLNKLRD